MTSVRQKVVLVFIGGSIGGSARIALLLASFTMSGYTSGLVAGMLSTLAVNMLGALVLGMLGRLYQANYLSESLWLLLGVGFCGAFTTVSAFALDVFIAWQSGLTYLAIAYALATFIGTIAAAAVGYLVIHFSLAQVQDKKTESSC